MEGENANRLLDDLNRVSLPPDPSTTVRDSRLVLGEVDGPSTNDLGEGTSLSEVGRDTNEGDLNVTSQFVFVSTGLTVLFFCTRHFVWENDLVVIAVPDL